ncbi:histidine phosphatase family protein [Paenisporosarcina antarctica]|uniref:Histidine phosphatase family protein n=1 Tax=Paenisporosarcina antarctica TaxID=417367 RepID=A0A4P7A2W7_9BACL|nr:histidine phosphatase family protein [Paenisporosarcina antarctica]QBP42799.1 histidine phosphatase family protein [Paenisporosarcina antarctica]
MLTLYITRHGQTEWNVQSRMQGWADSPLTATGVSAAIQLGKRLQDVPLHAVYSSTSGRAIDTAQLIIGERHIPLIQKEDLREINVGEWQGMLSSEIERDFADQVKTYYKHPNHFESTSGENFHSLKERVLRTVEEISTTHPAGHVLIVTHGVVKKCLINHFTGAQLDSLWDPPFIHGTSLTMMEIDNESQKFTMIGDMSHAEEARKPTKAQ